MRTETTQLSKAFGPVSDTATTGPPLGVERDGPGIEVVERPDTFLFGFDPVFRIAGAPFGILPSTTHIEVDDEVRIRFGPWFMRFPRTDVVAIEETGHTPLWRVLGPPRLSLADGGVTFATNASTGLRLSLSRLHPAIAPFDLIRHPAVTLTPELPNLLIRALAG